MHIKNLCRTTKFVQFDWLSTRKHFLGILKKQSDSQSSEGISTWCYKLVPKNWNFEFRRSQNGFEKSRKPNSNYQNPYPLGEKSRLTVTDVSSTLKLHLFGMNAARWLDEASDLKVEETAVNVSRLFSPRGYNWNPFPKAKIHFSKPFWLRLNSKLQKFLRQGCTQGFELPEKVIRQTILNFFSNLVKGLMKH